MLYLTQSTSWSWSGRLITSSIIKGFPCLRLRDTCMMMCSDKRSSRCCLQRVNTNAVRTVSWACLGIIWALRMRCCLQRVNTKAVRTVSWACLGIIWALRTYRGKKRRAQKLPLWSAWHSAFSEGKENILVTSNRNKRLQFANLIEVSNYRFTMSSVRKQAEVSIPKWKNNSFSPSG